MIRYYCSRCHTLLLNNKERCFKCGNGEVSQIEINVQKNNGKKA